MTAVGKLNPNSTIKEYVRGLNNESPVYRHIMLADIRASLGPEVFQNWYDEVYKLRRDGKQKEYEQAISEKFVSLAMGTDLRIKQRNDILYTLNEEPVTKETALRLIDQLAEIETSLQAHPPEFGSKAWFDGIEPIEF